MTPNLDLHLAELIYKHRVSRKRTVVNKWAGLHPELIKKLKAVHGKMAVNGFPMMLTDGLRTLAEQQALYKKGRNGVKGPIVTYADGVKVKSNHQAKKDGFGHAGDSTFVDPATGKPFWPDGDQWTKAWKQFGLLCVEVGLEWGGNWTRPVDRPHAQL